MSISPAVSQAIKWCNETNTPATVAVVNRSKLDEKAIQIQKEVWAHFNAHPSSFFYEIKFQESKALLVKIVVTQAIATVALAVLLRKSLLGDLDKSIKIISSLAVKHIGKGFEIYGISSVYLTSSILFSSVIAMEVLVCSAIITAIFYIALASLYPPPYLIILTKKPPVDVNSFSDFKQILQHNQWRIPTLQMVVSSDQSKSKSDQIIEWIMQDFVARKKLYLGYQLKPFKTSETDVMITLMPFMSDKSIRCSKCEYSSDIPDNISNDIDITQQIEDWDQKIEEPLITVSQKKDIDNLARNLKYQIRNHHLKQKSPYIYKIKVFNIDPVLRHIDPNIQNIKNHCRFAIFLTRYKREHPDLTHDILKKIKINLSSKDEGLIANEFLDTCQISLAEWWSCFYINLSPDDKDAIMRDTHNQTIDSQGKITEKAAEYIKYDKVCNDLSPTVDRQLNQYKQKFTSLTEFQKSQLSKQLPSLTNDSIGRIFATIENLEPVRLDGINLDHTNLLHSAYLNSLDDAKASSYEQLLKNKLAKKYLFPTLFVTPFFKNEKNEALIKARIRRFEDLTGISLTD